MHGACSCWLIRLRRWISGRLASGEGVDVGGFERLSTDGPVAAVELVDADPGDTAQALALHGDHGLGNVADELLLLLRREHVFDDVDGDHGHGSTPSIVGNRHRDRPDALEGIPTRAEPARMQVCWRSAGDSGQDEPALPYAVAMIYRFGTFELDLATLELRASGEVGPAEPEVFAWLALLVGNRERVISRDEILEKVWDGRVVSDSAIDSRIKSVRQVLGDNGSDQRFIKTVHRRGFRFVADPLLVG